MYIMLETAAAIQAAQREFEAAIAVAFPKVVRRNIGWQGGRRKNATIRTNGTYWFYTKDLREGFTPRRLNWFGRLGDGTGVSITLEVNTPYSGSAKMATGFFARDPKTGRTYLFHSGRVAGGMEGVKKDALLAWCDFKPSLIACSDGSQREGILVMPTTGAGAARAAVEYVTGVENFKAAVRSGKATTAAQKRKATQLRDYYDEHFGRKTGKLLKTQVDYISRHGEVVKELRQRLVRLIPPPKRIVKSQLLDLGVEMKGVLAHAYEVKSGCTRGELYTAIGQLMVHGAPLGCRKTLVVPVGPIPRDIADALTRNRIDLQRYRLREDGVTFLD